MEQSKMNQFKNIVPKDIQIKMQQIAEKIDLSDFLEHYAGFVDIYSEQEISPIEGNHKDGWIPRQDGGYSVTQFIANPRQGSCVHVTQKQSDWYEEQSRNCFKQWARDHEYDNPAWDALSEEEKESYYEYEDDWLDSFDLFGIDCFVDMNGYGGAWVTMRLWINYRDSPYYREKYADDITSTTYEIDEFRSMSIEQIIQGMMK